VALSATDDRPASVPINGWGRGFSIGGSWCFRGWCFKGWCFGGWGRGFSIRGGRGRDFTIGGWDRGFSIGGWGRGFSIGGWGRGFSIGGGWCLGGGWCIDGWCIGDGSGRDFTIGGSGRGFTVGGSWCLGGGCVGSSWGGGFGIGGGWFRDLSVGGWCDGGWCTGDGWGRGFTVGGSWCVGGWCYWGGRGGDFSVGSWCVGGGWGGGFGIGAIWGRGFVGRILPVGRSQDRGGEADDRGSTENYRRRGKDRGIPAEDDAQRASRHYQPPRRGGETGYEALLDREDALLLAASRNSVSVYDKRGQYGKGDENAVRRPAELAISRTDVGREDDANQGRVSCERLGWHSCHEYVCRAPDGLAWLFDIPILGQLAETLRAHVPHHPY